LQSFQVKFTALLVALLITACVGLVLVATKNERAALEAEAIERGHNLARSLAMAARRPLAAAGTRGERPALDAILREISTSRGLVAAQVRDGANEVVAGVSNATAGESPDGQETPDATPGRSGQAGRVLVSTAPIIDAGVRIGTARIVLDGQALVDSVVSRSTRQLSLLAASLVGVGIVAGTLLVALLVRPLRRLRSGVERLRDGDLSVRVPPAARDEVGALARAFNEMGDALEQKQRVQHAFGRYVNDYVLNQLLEGPEPEALAGIEREVTLLFCDIRGFTHLSEDMEARDVVALLHEIFQLVSDRILAGGGTIDKFMGDSVMAYFGAPVRQDDHAIRSVKAAAEIQRALAERNSRIDGDRASPVEMGIGIHTGSVVLGNIGSDRRTDFTAVGDAVNVAHRLEKLARPGEILVSEAVQRAVRTECRLRFEGERLLSGREEPVHVYSVAVDRDAATAG